MLNIELRPNVNVFIGDFDQISTESYICRHVPNPEHFQKPQDLKGVALELLNDGNQVIVSTHSYILLKWFDLLGENNVAYHSIYVEDGELCCETKDIYPMLTHNEISDVFSELYDKEVESCLTQK